MHTEMTFVVQDEHTDELGHLNHVAAVRILEQARDAWYHSCGLYRDDPNRYGTVIVNINYDYHNECFVGETLRVTTTPQRIGTKSIIVSHKILKPNDESAVSGEAISVVMDMYERTVIPIPECIAIHFMKPD